MSDEEEFHASGPKCTLGEGFTRRDRSSRVRKHTLGPGDQCDSVPWIVSVLATIVCVSGKRASGEVFTHRGRCVPRIVSFSATIHNIIYV